MWVLPQVTPRSLRGRGGRGPELLDKLDLDKEIVRALCKTVVGVKTEVVSASRRRRCNPEATNEVAFTSRKPQKPQARQPSRIPPDSGQEPQNDALIFGLGGPDSGPQMGDPVIMLAFAAMSVLNVEKRPIVAGISCRWARLCFASILRHGYKPVLSSLGGRRRIQRGARPLASACRPPWCPFADNPSANSSKTSFTRAVSTKVTSRGSTTTAWGGPCAMASTSPRGVSACVAQKAARTADRRRSANSRSAT